VLHELLEIEPSDLDLIPMYGESASND